MNRNIFHSSLGLLLLAVYSTCAAEKPPNVVLIFADDLGYGDVGCYGATKVKTPNIDGLAAEGLRFTDAHSVSAVCTPSRYALLTGQYPLRTNAGRGVWGPAPITSPLLIDTEKTTIADVFKSKGYATAVVGKWHLGFGKERNTWQEPLRPGPQDLGFDYYFGMPVVNSAPPYVYVENDRVVGGDPDDPLVYLGRNAKGATPITPIPPEAANRSANAFGGAKKAHEIFNDYQVGTTFAEKSVEWIEENRDKPFFLYLATTNIHHPFTPAKKFQGTSDCGLYGDSIHELDWIVGEVLSSLEENDLADSTLVIFTSDNGGMFNFGGQAAFKAGHRQNGELLGFKFGVWEGGHRVPMIVRWPGKVKPGTTSNQLIGNVDMLATFAALTGRTLEKAQQADSLNMLPAMVGEPEKPLRENLVLAPHKGTHLSVRSGKWMYIPARGSGGFGGKTPGDHTFAGPAAASFAGSVNSDIVDGKIQPDAPSAQLYDLEADVNQTRNVYDEHPEVVEEMKSLLAKYKPKPGPVRTKRKPASKTPAKPSDRSVSFDFESGKLEPWKIVEGEFGHIVGSRKEFFHNQKPYNKQGEHYLTTLESSPNAEKGMDAQTGVVVSPMFVPQRGPMTFRVGGGGGRSTYVALCNSAGKEEQIARGSNDQVMYEVKWDLTPFAGKKMFLKVVDQSTIGWGHITVDDFQFDAKILDEHPKFASIEKRDKSETQPKKHNPPSCASSTSKPNFVVIFTDDQGYADLSCFGGDHVDTPRIDQMAAEGSKLTSFYAAAPLCTPSRAGLMTGCYPIRIDMAYGSDFAVLLAADKKGLNPNEVTIAEVLKSVGYKTGIFGKWHLGDQPEFLPTRQGFDEYFGIPYSHDIHPFHPRQIHFKFPPLPLLENEKVIEMDPDADHLTRRVTEKAVEFINANKDEPFFLYVPHPIPHAPLHVSPSLMEDVPDTIKAKLKTEKRIDYQTRKKLFRPAIGEIDWSVGQILDALKKNEIDENTIVVFTSDNGPAIGKATPLRGRKGSTFEGGMREPTVVRWPGKIPAGKVNDEIMTTMDLLPTFAHLAGARVPSDRGIDGKDIWQTLTGEASTPHEAFFYYRDNGLQAVRSGKWKLHLKDGNPGQLCNLDTDIGETQNLAEDHPNEVKRLVAFAKAFQANIRKDNRPAAFANDPKPLSISGKEPTQEDAPAKLDSPRAALEKPNFVVIFADDLGYGDLSCYHPEGVATPHLNALAEQGFRSTDFFIPANVCSPSRAALLTGRYPMRCGIPVARTETPGSKYKEYGLLPDEITIPELLKTAGYRSLMVGKWHLGMDVEGSHPIDAGFDEHLGIPSNYSKGRGPNYNTLYRGNRVESKNVPCEELTARYTDEVLAFIERQRDEPFFIYVSHHIVHSPLLPSLDFVGSSGKGKYGDFIKELDHSTGRIMKAIRDAGLDENTLVVFTSDNGPTRVGSTGGLAGGKYCTMEGGHRVPGIFRWPRIVPAERISNATISSMDLLPLFCELAGVEQPSDRKIDGQNILPILQGDEKESPHKILYYYNGTNLQAVREGDWKLHLPRSPKDQPFWSKKPDKTKGFVTLNEVRLFNLKTDVGEQYDVAAQNPEIVARLQKRATTIRAELGDVRITGSDQRKINLTDPQER